MLRRRVYAIIHTSGCTNDLSGLHASKHKASQPPHQSASARPIRKRKYTHSGEMQVRTHIKCTLQINPPNYLVGLTMYIVITSSPVHMRARGERDVGCNLGICFSFLSTYIFCKKPRSKCDTPEINTCFGFTYNQTQSISTQSIGTIIDHNYHISREDVDVH